ncbi:MAG: fibronectin type III domain-containing protein [candidate division Zixibacteria bacterium]|nr:fibronectin type III domain-containing protein [candidate division Zixibacteria bacterium]MBU1471024.1 fibronectin type III domain-containing protein [candidate division Zixibacteria bacterium]MBU2625059.1 fibronectin type III domain-containing protein [candidate division Zixibacteria bacterium]
MHRKNKTIIVLGIVAFVAFACPNLLAQDMPDSAAVDLTLDSIAVLDDVQVATGPAPARLDIVRDAEGDQGSSVTLTWHLSPDDGSGADNVTGYEIFRAESPEGEFESVGTASKGMSQFEDATTTDGVTYYYYVAAFSDAGSTPSEISAGVRSSPQWFNSKDANTLVIGLIICLSVIYFIFHAQKGKKFFLRKIAGLEAVDEAIGRATEMGRPILFIPGIMDMDDVQTVAGITILGRIARTIADYDTKLNMPVSRSIVMTTARETIKQAYVAAGRPDAFSDDMVHYLTDEQFGYVAAVDGIMVREKPATCFYLGAFYAESLIMAETGNSIGAIQIAGTAMPAQLPFFVAACDYTLIGEELFAASAYLSGEPKQLGSLKGQDVGKIIAMVVILILCGLFTLAAITGSADILELGNTLQGWFSAS